MAKHWIPISVVGLALGAGWLAPSASATFPGINGSLAFGSQRLTADPTTSDCLAPPCEIRRIMTLAPGARRARTVPTCDGDARCHDQYPSWAPDGRRLLFERVYFSPGSEEPDRFTVALFDPNRGVRTLSGDVSYLPAWAPSGQRLILGKGDELHISDLAGASSQLTRGAGSAGYADWSARGTIVFVRRRGRRSDLYIRRPSGPSRRLTRTGDALEPSFSPGGTKIAFARARRPGLYIVPVRGGRPRRVVRGDIKSPVWSPDGKKVAFIRRSQIVVARSDGSGLQPRLKAIGRISRLSWQSRR